MMSRDVHETLGILAARRKCKPVVYGIPLPMQAWSLALGIGQRPLTRTFVRADVRAAAMT